MGAVADRSATTLPLVKQYCRINGTADDFLVQFLLDAAKDDADAYLGNAFLDDAGNALPIPKKVERWLLKEVARDWHNRPAGLTQEIVSAMGQVTWAERDYNGIFSAWEPRI